MTLDPSRLHRPIALRNGTPALIRAIRADDRQRLATAFLGLEPESVYLRYFSYKRELTEADLDRLTRPDFHERVVLVVTLGGDSDAVIIGSGGYVMFDPADDSRGAEIAFAVEEDFHGQGIAGELLTTLAEIARAQSLPCLVAEVLAHNVAMLRVFERSGLPMRKSPSGDHVVRVTLTLAGSTAADVSR